MRRASPARRLLPLAILLLALAAPVDALAQCSMCAANAEASGEPEQVARTLLTAVGFLLIPTVGLLGGAGVLLWRYRGATPLSDE